MFRLMCLESFRPAVDLLDVVFSSVDDVFQGAQDQRVHVAVQVDFLMVVLHREDAVQGNTSVDTELLHLVKT